VEPIETADLGEPPAPASAPSRTTSEAEVVPSPEGRAVGAVPAGQPSRGATAEPLLEEGAVGPAPRSSPRREYLPYRPAYLENDRYLQPEQRPDRRRPRSPSRSYRGNQSSGRQGSEGDRSGRSRELPPSSTERDERRRRRRRNPEVKRARDVAFKERITGTQRPAEGAAASVRASVSGTFAESTPRASTSRASGANPVTPVPAATGAIPKMPSRAGRKGSNPQVRLSRGPPPSSRPGTSDAAWSTRMVAREEALRVTLRPSPPGTAAMTTAASPSNRPLGGHPPGHPAPSGAVPSAPPGFPNVGFRLRRLVKPRGPNALCGHPPIWLTIFSLSGSPPHPCRLRRLSVLGHGYCFRPRRRKFSGDRPWCCRRPPPRELRSWRGREVVAVDAPLPSVEWTTPFVHQSG